MLLPTKCVYTGCRPFPPALECFPLFLSSPQYPFPFPFSYTTFKMSGWTNFEKFVAVCSGITATITFIRAAVDLTSLYLKKREAIRQTARWRKAATLEKSQTLRVFARRGRSRLRHERNNNSRNNTPQLPEIQGVDGGGIQLEDWSGGVLMTGADGAQAV